MATLPVAYFKIKQYSTVSQKMTKLWENSNPAASILLLNQEIMVVYCNSVIVVITVSYCKIDNCKINSNILATLLPVFCCLFEGQFVPVQYEP